MAERRASAAAAEAQRRALAERRAIEAVSTELKSGPPGALGLLAAPSLLALRYLARLQGRLSEPEFESVPSKETDDSATTATVEGELFVQGGSDSHAIEMEDVDQGALGDCYLMALLGSIARVQPHVIENMVTDNGDGTYTVDFQTEQGWFGKVETQSVTVDNLFWEKSNGKPLYAGVGDSGPQGPELWTMVIEKAWAEMHGGYAQITGGNIDSNPYVAVTGHEATSIDPSSVRDDVLQLWLMAHFSLGHEPVVLGTKGDKKLPEGGGLVGNHAYVLSDIDSSGTVTLYNPHGPNIETPYVTLHVSELAEHFARIRFVDVDAP